MSIGKYLVERKYLGRRKDVSEVEGVRSKARGGNSLREGKQNHAYSAGESRRVGE